MKIGLITGTGLESFGAGQCQNQALETPYGRVAMEYMQVGDREVYLLPRHGRDHDTPPHMINYRANIMALKMLGCEMVVATNAVGSLQQAMEPKQYVLPDQFLDFTRVRPLTFFDGEDGEVRHVDVTEPYCPAMRAMIAQVLEERGLPVHAVATYVCTEGPRFETPAEIRMFRSWGADVVGMTGLPEVVLAREVGLCYASLCIVTNYAAGMTGGPIEDDEVGALMHSVGKVTTGVLEELVQRLQPGACTCRGVV